MRSLAVLLAAAAVCLSACGQSSQPTTPAPAPPTAASPAAKVSTPADDPVVCCEFNGATGSSTRTLCASYHGTERPSSACPGM